MKDLIKSLDSLPLLAKIILALPGIDIIWNVSRVMRSLVKGNNVGAVIAAVLIVVGIPFVWAIDIVTLLLYNKIWWID
ncbi:MAG: hypothetical protein SOZ62_05495 [Eubacteriales bacterium]|nr:hypothetical protein [Eubacteriales bacterium]